MAFPRASAKRRELLSMKRNGIERGLVTLSISGGQGIALALEAMN